MFGLSNVSGSCWVNACLQSLFRIPAVQERYSKPVEFVNALDENLHRLWVSKGKDGLREFFAAVRTDLLPAGQNIGDSHELLVHLCDQLPWLDALFRFKVGYSLACKHCEYREIKDESTLEFTVHSQKEPITISQCIVEATQLQVIEDWTCEKCKQKGCTKQMLMGSFPKTLLFHKISTGGSMN